MDVFWTVVLPRQCPWCESTVIGTVGDLGEHCNREHPAEFAELTVFAQAGD